MVFKRIVLYGFLALLVAGIAVALTSHDRADNKSESPVVSLLQNQDLTLNHIHHVATQDGVTEWILDAESATYQRAENKTVFKAISATFFLKGGREVHLTARDGVLLTDTKDMKVSGDVVLKSDPYELKTQKLIYKHGSKTISTEAPVRIEGKLVSLAGHRMFFNLKDEKLIVTGGVKAVINQNIL